MSTSKKLALGCIVAAVLMAVPSTGHAFPACDSFGQDWNILLGPFGGTFPGSLVVTGCRDCNGSLACSPGSGPFAIAGVAVATTGTGGAPYSLVWSMTSFDKPADGCVSVNWTGSHPSTSTTVSGNWTNEVPSSGTFTLRLGAVCTTSAEAPAGADPSSPE